MVEARLELTYTLFERDSPDWGRGVSEAPAGRTPEAADEVTGYLPGHVKTTVLIPAFNNEATIRRAVESVFAQTVTELEVIVVDDGSALPVAALLHDVHDARLRVISHDRNRGTAAARQTALCAARSPLISHLDADDTWEHNYLEAVLPRLEDPQVGVVYANATLVGHPLGWTDYMRDLPYMPDPSEHPIDAFPGITHQDPIPALTATARTQAVKDVGGYPRWLRFCDDYYLFLQLAAAGWRFAYVDERLANYRWPTAAGGASFDHRAQAVNLLKMWAVLAVRHRHLPGPTRQLRRGVRAQIRSLEVGMRLRALGSKAQRRGC
jgi:glycosyltransferase involved in cell wall biosynthesis